MSKETNKTWVGLKKSEGEFVNKWIDQSLYLSIVGKWIDRMEAMGGRQAFLEENGKSPEHFATHEALGLETVGESVVSEFCGWF